MFHASFLFFSFTYWWAFGLFPLEVIKSSAAVDVNVYVMLLLLLVFLLLIFLCRSSVHGTVLYKNISINYVTFWAHHLQIQTFVWNCCILLKPLCVLCRDSKGLSTQPSSAFPALLLWPSSWFSLESFQYHWDRYFWISSTCQHWLDASVVRWILNEWTHSCVS